MEKKSRNMILLAMVVIVLIAALAFVVMSTPNGGNIVITDGVVIDQASCQARGIADKVVVFHSTGCPACSIAVPILEEIEKETDVEFEFINLAENAERLEELKLTPTKIPTAVINCKVYVGAKTKDYYMNLIEG